MNALPMLLRRSRKTELSPQLLQAFRREQQSGLLLTMRVRFAALLLIAIWIATRVAAPASLYYLAILLLFAIFGLGQIIAGRREGAAFVGIQLSLVFLDMALLAFALVVPNPMTPDEWPPAMQLRLGNFDFFYVFIAFAVLSYSPGYALWAGLAAAIAWSAGTHWILAHPGTFTVTDMGSFYEMGLDRVIALLLDRNYVSSIIWIQQVVVAILIAGIMAAAVWRSRRLALEQVRSASERANLARYFSPNMVEELSQSEEAFRKVRTQAVSVLFVDIVGFTRLSENLESATLIETLRQFHGRMAQAVFDNYGTVDKYIGDALMATFGTPYPGPKDASNALNCAQSMAQSVAAWNEERQAAGLDPIRIGIGAHYGPVVLGDIGSETTLEFAVLGDTVNVASRLEGLTRDLSAMIVVSQALYEQARLEGFEAAALEAFAPGEAQKLRNRAEPLGVMRWQGGHPTPEPKTGA